jgi:hypothetical protein
MPDRAPLTPIFNPGIHYGHVNVGTQIGFRCPSTLTIVGSRQDSTNLNSAGFAVAYTGGHAIVTGDDGRAITSVDVTDPTNPTVAHNLDLGAASNPRAIAMYGTYAIVGCDGFVQVVDASDPTAMTVAATLTDAQVGNALHIEIVGDRAFLATGNTNRVTVLDLSPIPSTPTITNSLADVTVLDDIQGLAVNLPWIYCSSNDDNRFVVINAADPDALTLTGGGNVVATPNLRGIRSVVYLGGDLVAVTCNNNLEEDRIIFIDVSDPTTPTIVGSYVDDAGTPLLNGISDIHVSPIGCLYVSAAISDMVHRIDYSNLASITIAATVSSPGANLDEATGFAINGNMLYVGAIAQDRLTVIQGS